MNMSDDIETTIPPRPYPPRRGRPPSLLGAKPAVDTDKPSPRAAAEKATRRRRRDMGPESGLRLSIPPHLKNDPNYRYYWANDKPGRLEQLTKNDDWDFVTDDMVANDPRNTGVGSRIERFAGTDAAGQPMKNYLLRKRKEFDEEDQAAKHRVNDERMAAVAKGQTPGATPVSGLYIPERGITLQDNKR